MKAKYRRQLFTGKNGDFFWRLREQNRDIVADSAEGYRRRIDAAREFDTITSFKELQTLHNTQIQLQVELREKGFSKYAKSLQESCVLQLERIQGLIDRSESGLPVPK